MRAIELYTGACVRREIDLRIGRQLIEIYRRIEMEGGRNAEAELIFAYSGRRILKKIELFSACIINFIVNRRDYITAAI